MDKIFSDKLKIYGQEQKYLFVKLPYIGKYSARIKRDLMKILKDYRPYTKLRLISYHSIKIGHLFKNCLDKYLSAKLLTLYIKFPTLVATHILGKLAAVYLTESGSIKMRLPSHLDSHMWLNTEGFRT